MAKFYYFKEGTILKDPQDRWWKVVKYNPSSIALDNHYIMESIDRKHNGPVSVMVNPEYIYNYMVEVTKAEQVLYGC